MDLESKFLGGMLGSALGDCIGELAFDYKDEASLIQIVKEIPLLVYTDDTAMAIGLAESLLSTQGRLDLEHLGTTFKRNFRHEPFRGYASGPPSIFSTVDQTGASYVEIAQNLFGGTGSFGNGAAMRITPLGLFFFDSPDLYEEAKRSAIVTHAHPLGIDGAALLAKAISLMVLKDPEDKEKIAESNDFWDTIQNFVQTKEFGQKIHQMKELLSQDVLREFAASKLGTNVTSLGSVPFSIFSFLKNPYSFETCLLETVLIRGDRDTIGAMVGGLLGSYLGVEAIPMKWLKKLENRHYIEELAKKLFELKERLL
ncbi:MAG: ADP-ribosylglycohydrolase family protein [Candidatus Hermodarchaeota archaeon]